MCVLCFTMIVSFYIWSDDGPKGLKHAAYMKIHSCFRLYVTIY